MIVIGVLPLVIGAIAVGIISVFSLQTSVSNRLTDSGDQQVIAVNFQRDVQSAISLTTSSSTVGPAQCNNPAQVGGTNVLSLQLGNSTEITYTAAKNGTAYTLSRNMCTLSGGTPTFESSVVLGRDLPAWTVPTTYTVNLTSTTNFVENGVTAPTYANVCVGGMAGAAGTISGTAVTASTVYVNPPATPQTKGLFGTVTSAGRVDHPG